MGRNAEVEVTAPNLYRSTESGSLRRCAIGDRFTITLNNDGEVPMLYRGKVRIFDEQKMQVATPDAVDNETGNQGDSGDDADDQRKEWLMDQIEELTGKRPGARSKLETLEEKYEEAKLAE